MILVIVIVCVVISSARWLFPLRARILTTSDFIPLSVIRERYLAKLARIPDDHVQMLESVHRLVRAYLAESRHYPSALSRTGREMRVLSQSQSVRRFEEVYTASRFDDTPLDEEGRRRFRRMAEDIILQ